MYRQILRALSPSHPVFRQVLLLRRNQSPLRRCRIFWLCRDSNRSHLARQRRKLANRRKTHYQLTAAIAARFDGIAVEDLQVKNMTASAKGAVESPGQNVRQKAGLNREILDTSPGMMISMLRYKAARAGGWFAVVDARNTSQDCSECGRTVPKDLSVRIRKMRALPDGGPPRRQRGPERPETGRSGSVERLWARKQRPGCRPSLRKPQREGCRLTAAKISN